MIINLESLVESKPYYNGRLVLLNGIQKSDEAIVSSSGERVMKFKIG